MKLSRLIANIVGLRSFSGISNRPWGASGSDIEAFAESLYGVPSYTFSFDENEFKILFKKNALAQRVISMYPKECWRTMPVVNEGTTPEETPFEKAWGELVSDTKLKLLKQFKNADVLMGIGEFGIIYLGLADGEDPSVPASTSNNKLLYLRSFDQTNVSVLTKETDRKNERYGLPLTYQIRFTNDGDGNQTNTVVVHWTRVIHLAENCIDSPVYGEPRLRAVIEQILNITLILKGSPHMYMRGGFPGYAFEADPDVVITESDRTAMKTQIEDYVASLQRFLTLQGVTAKSLDVQIADPDPFIKVQIAAISAHTGIPGRMLSGSEMGHLASTADKMTWEDRVHDRQETELTPDFILPLIDRLQMLGILPPTTDEIVVTWNRVDSASQKERAEVSKIKAEALAKYASVPTAPLIVPEEHFLRHFLGFTPSVITEIMNGESLLPDLTEDVNDDDKKTEQGGSVRDDMDKQKVSTRT